MSRQSKTPARFVSLFYKTVSPGPSSLAKCLVLAGYGVYRVLGVGWVGAGYWVWVPGNGGWVPVPGTGVVYWLGYCTGLGCVLALVLYWTGLGTGLGCGTVALAGYWPWLWYSGLGCGVPGGTYDSWHSEPHPLARLIPPMAAIVALQPWRLPQPWK